MQGEALDVLAAMAEIEVSLYRPLQGLTTHICHALTRQVLGCVAAQNAFHH